MNILFTCICATYMTFTHEGQNRKSDSFELELQMVLGHYMGAVTGTLILWKSSSAHSH